MTEHAWLTSTDPAAMLRYLDPGNARVGKVGDPDTSHLWTPKRLRLFACACARIIWHRLGEENRQAIAWQEDHPDEPCPGPGTEIMWAGALRNVDWRTMLAVSRIGGEWTTQADLLRCIFGNPWKPVTICPQRVEDRPGGDRVHVFDCPDPDEGYHAPHCPLSTPAVVSLARAVHDDRDWAALPVLADLLEEAGCANKDILMHLRGWVRCPNCLSGQPARPDLWGFCDQCRGMRWRARGGTHARGCHALEAILREE